MGNKTLITANTFHYTETDIEQQLMRNYKRRWTTEKQHLVVKEVRGVISIQIGEYNGFFLWEVRQFL